MLLTLLVTQTLPLLRPLGRQTESLANAWSQYSLDLEEEEKERLLSSAAELSSFLPPVCRHVHVHLHRHSLSTLPPDHAAAPKSISRRAPRSANQSRDDTQVRDTSPVVPDVKISETKDGSD